MPQLRSSEKPIDFRKPFQIAQAEGEHSGTPAAEGGETHTSTGHGEHEPEPGEIPNARLLFGNALVVAIVMIAFALAARKNWKWFRANCKTLPK